MPGTRLLAPVEWLGQVLALALAALLNPLGRAALWLFLFLRRQWERIRPPRSGWTSVAEEIPSDLSQEPSKRPKDGGSQPVASVRMQPATRPLGFSWRVGAVYVLVVLCWAC
jgi:hypothetical protein